MDGPIGRQAALAKQVVELLKELGANATSSNLTTETVAVLKHAERLVHTASRADEAIRSTSRN